MHDCFRQSGDSTRPGTANDKAQSRQEETVGTGKGKDACERRTKQAHEDELSEEKETEEAMSSPWTRRRPPMRLMILSE